MEERRKCLEYYKQNINNQGDVLEWHYFKRAWDICVENNNCHINSVNGEVNPDVLYSVIKTDTVDKNIKRYNSMEEVIELVKKVQIKYNDNLAGILFNGDGSGRILDRNNEKIISFQTIEELKKIIECN